MGKRAKKAPVQTKKKQTLARQFKCPFCANGAFNQISDDIILFHMSLFGSFSLLD